MPAICPAHTILFDSVALKIFGNNRGLLLAKVDVLHGFDLASPWSGSQNDTKHHNVIVQCKPRPRICYNLPDSSFFDLPHCRTLETFYEILAVASWWYRLHLQPKRRKKKTLTGSGEICLPAKQTGSKTHKNRWNLHSFTKRQYLHMKYVATFVAG